MSELSTVAIKDGHRGHFPHHHQHNPLEAERADRISRLAGLERVATARQSGASNTGASTGQPAPAPGFFDPSNNPHMARERSTVGSASATGSVGGRTTWASGSDVYDPDKMSEDQDGDVDVGDAEGETTSSVGGFSDEAGSLVGFGEGARTPARAHSTAGVPVGSPAGGRSSAAPPYLRDSATSPMPGATPARQDARMINGMTYDSDVMDTADRTPPPAADTRSLTAVESSQRLVRDKADRRDVGSGGRQLVSGDGSM